MKNIVITGSTRGIGFSLTNQFLKRGCNVIINGRTQKSVENALAKLKNYSQQIIGIPGDITNKETHQKMFNQCKKTFGSVDIWINNAGVGQKNTIIEELDKKDIEFVFDINVKGLILGSSVAIKGMKEQGFGKIFNMEGFGSDGRVADKMAVYGASKRAVTYFSKACSYELKKFPIQVGTLSPGMVITDFLNESLTGTAEEIAHKKKFYNILGDKPERVTPFLAQKILNSRKEFDQIKWLTPKKIFLRFLFSSFRKRDLFNE